MFYPLRWCLTEYSQHAIGSTTAVSGEYDFECVFDPLTFAYSCYIIRWRPYFVAIEYFCARIFALPLKRVRQDAPLLPYAPCTAARNAGFLRFRSPWRVVSRATPTRAVVAVSVLSSGGDWKTGAAASSLAVRGFSTVCGVGIETGSRHVIDQR